MEPQNETEQKVDNTKQLSESERRAKHMKYIIDMDKKTIKRHIETDKEMYTYKISDKARSMGMNYDSPIERCLTYLTYIENFEYNKESETAEVFDAFLKVSIELNELILSHQIAKLELNEIKRQIETGVIEIRLRYELNRLSQTLKDIESRKISIFDGILGKSKKIKEQQEQEKSVVLDKINKLRQIYSDLSTNGLSQEYDYAPEAIMAEIELLEVSSLPEEDRASLLKLKSVLEVFRLERILIDNLKNIMTQGEQGEFDLEFFIRQAGKEILTDGGNPHRRESKAEELLRKGFNILRESQKTKEKQQERKSPEIPLDEI